MRETNHTSLVDDFGVDYRRPVFGQLDSLGDRYWDWVHEHVGPKRRQALADHDPAARWPGSFPIFANAWFEANTHISWRLVVSLWVPTVVLLLAGAAWRGVGGREAAGLAAAGFLLWTLVEYVLHRVAFHHHPRSSFGRKVHFLAHGIHHKDPWDPTRLVFPPLAGYGIALVLFVLLDLVLPVGAAMASMAGLLVGYLCYDLGHFAWHHAGCRRGLLKFLKRYHLAHHFKDQDSRYGVSQPLWDLVFRSGNLHF